MKVIDLKDSAEFVEQYIDLRNYYAELLLSRPVTLEETRNWLKHENIEIRGLVDKEDFLGAIILYLDKDGEVGFFVRDQNQGIGTELLRVIEEVAKNIGLSFLWAWVLETNTIAKHVFQKNGFILVSTQQRRFKDKDIDGSIYKKYLKYNFYEK